LLRCAGGGSWRRGRWAWGWELGLGMELRKGVGLERKLEGFGVGDLEQA